MAIAVSFTLQNTVFYRVVQVYGELQTARRNITSFSNSIQAMMEMKFEAYFFSMGIVLWYFCPFKFSFL